jgi:hypothetical protein
MYVSAPGVESLQVFLGKLELQELKSVAHALTSIYPLLEVN